jgi:hypothetical protein
MIGLERLELPAIDISFLDDPIVLELPDFDMSFLDDQKKYEKQHLFPVVAWLSGKKKQDSTPGGEFP